MKIALARPTAISVAGTLLTVLLLARLLWSAPALSRQLNSLFSSVANASFLRPHVPNFRNVPNVEYYDLRNYQGDPNGWQRENRILFLVPLRDAAEHLPRFFNHMDKMSYPHNLIDFSFLVSDSSDDTMGALLSHLEKAQSIKDKSRRFGNIEIYEKDFGQAIGQSFSDRHGFEAQGPRRKLMARARNWLGTVALKPYHSWVYWRDVDVELCPSSIMEDLMHHDRDVIVPNVWRPLPDWLGNIQPYDLNSWKESEVGVQLADSLKDENAVIVEGYPDYSTWRTHLAYMRDPNGNPEDEMELDGIGGVSILSKAKVFRTGSHFPAFSFEKHAETEAFGKLSRRMGYSVVGLPHYVIWHIYEPSTEDLKHMAWMAEEERRRVEEDRLREFYDRVWDTGFQDVRDQWRDERLAIFKNIDHTMAHDREVFVDWSDDINEQRPDQINDLRLDFDPEAK
ncbi:ZYBA0S09-01684g1_1 [Zygosaccharomyces bailii CLIB 213]|uniref:ZYBA0S09-01684g1_1 n=1 Tax=Zygosaccharomyces bailii (strain CLIB 213 / ATCC 58445 / CBS 680 / BCRC 21525 / NBRC 1098 / NCYC 1416 / NRRL Y-2227) TaxID=1333698 RepID=A0A8J2X9M9_ZYGB2|nr:ZYBA0S09-01684g1_1 [Zygosaccharomyces bailii CLIB 213]